jgi:hypothetical protein
VPLHGNELNLVVMHSSRRQRVLTESKTR